MTTTLSKDEQFAILRKDICYCGRAKQRGKAFCRGCFHRLTQSARDALYTRVPGFTVAYPAAVEQLTGRAPRRAGYQPPKAWGAGGSE